MSFTQGIASAVKGESEWFFWLGWIPFRFGDDSLGNENCPTQAGFLTEEGRTYFMQAEAEREAHSYTAQELREVEAQLAEINAKREKRRIARANKTKP